MLLAAPHRTGMLLGYAFAGIARWAFTATMVTILALLAGMTVYGSGVELTGLIGVGLLVNVASTLFGAGVSFRTKTLQAGPLMQVPIFVAAVPRAGLRAAQPAERMDPHRRVATTR